MVSEELLIEPGKGVGQPQRRHCGIMPDFGSPETPKSLNFKEYSLNHIIGSETPKSLSSGIFLKACHVRDP